MTSVLTHPASTATDDDRLDVHFVEPMPGFDSEPDYALTRIDPDGILYAMRSVQDPALRFVLTPANVFFGGYHPVLAETVAASLDADGPDDVVVMLLLTIGAGLRDATANLRAPVVIAQSTGRARQVLLDDESLPMQAPLLG